MLTIQERLAKVCFFEVKPDCSSLSQAEKRVAIHCAEAALTMTKLYLKQVWAGNPHILDELREREDKEGKDLLKYFRVHGSPWDGYNHNETFIEGLCDKPQFGSFYPHDMRENEWEKWLTAHPKDRKEFESNFTVIRKGGKKLVAAPYSEAYIEYLTDAANHLRGAASLLPNGKLKTFLQLRADAFRSNDYFESDLAWVDTDGTPIEVMIGPNETEIDGFRGLKAAFEAHIALPDKVASSALARFAPAVPAFDQMLSQEFKFNQKGAAIPIEVVSDIIRGGEANFGYFFVAYNLPNDRRVHELKGSKKVISATMMGAKFSKLTQPIAERILPTYLQDSCTYRGRLLFVLAHELSHGMGPGTVQVDGRDMPFETAFKELHSCLEEAKADMLGVRLLDYFHSYDLIDDKTLEECIVTEIASYFQVWRQGFTESHSRGHLIEYNWLVASKALRFDEASGRLHINVEACIGAMTRLSTKLLNIQVSGDYNKAKDFMEFWGVVPPKITNILNSLSGIPISICPIWNLSGLK
jgi:hypothetical protein